MRTFSGKGSNVKKKNYSSFTDKLKPNTIKRELIHTFIEFNTNNYVI